MPDRVFPIRFDPSMEHIASLRPESSFRLVSMARENMAREIQGALIDTLRSISETTFAYSGHATRSIQAKSHGVLRGKVTVLPGLPPDLAQGLFARPGEYDVFHAPGVMCWMTTSLPLAAHRPLGPSCGLATHIREFCGLPSHA